MIQKSKPKTKKEGLIQLLSHKAGADVATISEKLGWLPHTTRAALTGLRKALSRLLRVAREMAKIRFQAATIWCHPAIALARV
ncbi:MAG: DUF3489 domain-containing protein [Silicimonas sp.]